MRRRIVIAGTAAAAASIGTGLWYRNSGPNPTEAIWHMRFERPDGSELLLSDFKGKPLLLNFWATWCPPCVKELPLLDRFQREQRARGWRVVGLAIDQRGPVREYLERLPVGFDVGLAGFDGADLARSLGNTGGGLPYTIVFDRKGNIAHRRLGSIQPDDLAGWSTSVE